MKRKLSSRLSGLGVVLLIWLFIGVGVALAAVPTPTTYTIVSIEAYQSVVVTNDQLYLVSFDLSDSTSINESATEAWLVRMLDEGVEIATVAPYAFYNSGYAQGLVSFYFDPLDADLPTWSTANLSIELTGNPSLDWGGDPPRQVTSSIGSWNVGNTLVPARIRVIATGLEADYSIDMIEAGGAGMTVLTAYGEEYFETVIANLRLIAPNLFSSVISQPQPIEHSYNQTYQHETETRFQGDTTFGLDTLATLLRVSRMTLISVLYLIFSIALSIIVCRNLESMRPMLFLCGGLLTVGGAVGFAAMEAPIWVGILGVAILIFTFFWRESP